MAFGHFFFGLSQIHGHGSWLMCEVALSALSKGHVSRKKAGNICSLLQVSNLNKF